MKRVICSCKRGESIDVSDDELSEVRRISVLEYNTHLFDKTLPGLFGVFQKSSKPTMYQEGRRKKGIIKKIKQSNFDIVCLCEIWADSNKKKFVKELKEMYPYYIYDRCPEKSMKLGSGCLIFSKLRIADYKFKKFKKLGKEWNKYALKGVFFILFEVEKGHYFRLFFTHTPGKWDNVREIQKFSGIKGDQEVNSVFHPEIKDTIIMGDLNVKLERQSDKKYLKMMNEVFENGVDDCRQTLIEFPKFDCNNLYKKFWKSKYVYKNVDYILKSKNSRRFCGVHNHQIITHWKYKDKSDDDKIVERDLSDHFPLQCTLLFK